MDPVFAVPTDVRNEPCPVCCRKTSKPRYLIGKAVELLLTVCADPGIDTDTVVFDDTVFLYAYDILLFAPLSFLFIAMMSGHFYNMCPDNSSLVTHPPKTSKTVVALLRQA